MNIIRVNVKMIPETIYNFFAIDEFDNNVKLSKFKSKATVIVNISSKDPDAVENLKKLYMMHVKYVSRGMLII